MLHINTRRLQIIYSRTKIVALKQDKGRGVVIVDMTKYTEKCMSLLNTKHF